MTTANDDKGGAPPAGGDQPTQPPAAPVAPAPHPILGMNADKAKAFVADQALEDLDAVEAAEKTNQNNPNGRKSVLAAIADRRAKLTAPKDTPKGDQGDQAAEGQDEAAEDIELVPEATGNKSDKAIDLLLAACERFGVHPAVQRRPRELAAWHYYPGSRVDGLPDAVVIITNGGVKLKTFADPDYPMDPDTDEKLHQVFNAFKLDKDSKLQTPIDLPKNLTLPDTAVTGQVTSQRHRYVGGYLRRQGSKVVTGSR